MAYQTITALREFPHCCAGVFLGIFGLIVNFHFSLEMLSQYSICRQGKGVLKCMSEQFHV